MPPFDPPRFVQWCSWNKHETGLYEARAWQTHERLYAAYKDPDGDWDCVRLDPDPGNRRSLSDLIANGTVISTFDRMSEAMNQARVDFEHRADFPILVAHPCVGGYSEVPGVPCQLTDDGWWMLEPKPNVRKKSTPTGWKLSEVRALNDPAEGIYMERGYYATYQDALLRASILESQRDRTLASKHPSKQKRTQLGRPNPLSFR